MKAFIAFLFVLACPLIANSQGLRFGDNFPITTAYFTPGPIQTVPNATISVCSHPANAVPCTNRITTYTSITTGTSCPSNQQVVLAGTTTCVSQTDSYGNWGVWIASGGTFDFTVTTTAGASFGPFWVSVGGSGSGSCSGSVDQILYTSTGSNCIGASIYNAVFGGVNFLGSIPGTSGTYSNNLSWSAIDSTTGNEIAQIGTLAGVPFLHLWNTNSGGSTMTCQAASTGVAGDCNIAQGAHENAWTVSCNASSPAGQGFAAYQTTTLEIGMDCAGNLNMPLGDIKDSSGSFGGTGQYLGWASGNKVLWGTPAGAGTTVTIASGTVTLATSAIASGACATTVTASASGVASTDNLMVDFNLNPTSTTGWNPSTGVLSIFKWPSTNQINVAVCNTTASSITPGAALTLNYRVVR